MSAARPVRITLSRSFALAGAIVCAHAAAAASVSLVLGGTLGGVLAGALFGLGIAAAWSRALLGSPGSVQAIELHGPLVILRLRDGRSFEARIAARRYIGAWLVALPVLAPMRRTILVTADMAEGDMFRLLRIWAAWGKTPAAAAKRLPV